MQHVIVKLLLLLLLLGSSRNAVSELLLFERAGGEGQPVYNRLTVPSNHVAFLNWWRQGQETVVMPALLVVEGRTNVARVSTEPQIPIVGPAELLFTNACAIQYRIVTNTGFSTFVITNGQSITITVPGAQTIRFLPSVYKLTESSPVVLSNATTSVRDITIWPGAELDGPLTITFQHPRLAGQTLSFLGYTYYFTAPSTPLPDGVAIQTGSGHLDLRVEKSADFKIWTPSIIQPVENDQKLFYRLNVSR